MNLGHLVLYTVLVHGAFACARVVLSLFALHLHASPFTVGLIMSLLAFIPMLVSVHAGRAIDRLGPRRPMIWGGAFVLAGILLPVAMPSLATLFFVGPVSGFGFLLFHIAVHQAVGQIGEHGDHTRNFGVLAVAFSASSFMGPMIAGFSIDLVGHRATFLLSAVVATVALALMSREKEPPRRAPTAHGTRKRHVMDLLRSPDLRPVLMVSALLSMAWDLFSFAVPLYGVQIGLSASKIGVILGTFGFAIFSVRLVLPFVARHVREWPTLVAAMLVTGVGYGLLPLMTSATLLIMVAILTGLGLGAAQPMIMALIYRTAPPDRAGEAVGVRSMLINVSQTGIPLVSGAFGAALGMAPAFLLMAGLLALGSFSVRKRL